MPIVSRVFAPVTALGPGNRLGIWFQGCPLACPGCLARDTWDPDGGQQVGVADLVAAWHRAGADGADGVTITGGEPTEQPAELVALLRALRQAGPATADILLYTGLDWDDLRDRCPDAVGLADAVITGRYLVTAPTELIWRGSANQTLHLLTPLGTERYGGYRDYRPARPPMQVGVDDTTIWYVGVPRAGDLNRLERRMRERGITAARLSWRP